MHSLSKSAPAPEARVETIDLTIKGRDNVVSNDTTQENKVGVERPDGLETSKSNTQNSTSTGGLEQTFLKFEI